MSHINRILISFLLCISVIFTSLPTQPVSAKSEDIFTFILLSQDKGTMNIGEDLYLLALTSNGKQPTWKSSDSKVASVNTYGIVTAKKAGSALITAKITNAEASCYITVNKTVLSISDTSASIERGETLQLSATTSNSSKVTWKSSKKSIATVDENGLVTGLKPGETSISATADGASTACTVTVKKPTLQMNKTSVSLYRGQTLKLSATVSSHVAPTWKTNKKSVAVVDSYGSITAIKNGTATITATVDGVDAICYVTVVKPDITISTEEVTLKKGESIKLTASVSSGNSPVWTTSNSNVLSINSYGEITAKQKGKAFVYATEDGTKARCTVNVTD